MKGSNSNDIETLKISSPFGLTNQDPTWTMAQWGSKYNLKEAELLLDLGDVKNLAEVFVNGEYLGILWNKMLFCKN